MARMLMTPGVTQREIGLITAVLTAASIFASWQISKMYAGRASSQQLRDQGVQIASGIMLLKRQIETLADWVDEKNNERSGVRRDSSSAHILEHIEETLSVFDAMAASSLGAIGGVIGDALAQYEDLMGQIAITRAEAIKETTKIQSEMNQTSSDEELAALQAQVEKIAADTERKIALLSRSSAFPIPEPSSRRTVTVPCPNCHRDDTFEMKDRLGQTVLRICDQCAVRYNVHSAAGNRLIVKRDSPGASARRGINRDSSGSKAMVSKRWIEPEHLTKLISVIVSIDNGLTPSEKTPRRLLEESFRSAESTGLSNTVVREFFNAVYRNHGFIFPDGDASFDGRYLNQLTEGSLLTAYARSFVWTLCNSGEFALEDAVELAQNRFGSTFPGAVEVLRRELAAMLPTVQVESPVPSEPPGGNGALPS
jgi:NTP pyrophosphatase (non-canonical NTP hydrolase)